MFATICLASIIGRVAAQTTCTQEDCFQNVTTNDNIEVKCGSPKEFIAVGNATLFEPIVTWSPANSYKTCPEFAEVKAEAEVISMYPDECSSLPYELDLQKAFDSVCGTNVNDCTFSPSDLIEASEFQDANFSQLALCGSLRVSVECKNPETVDTLAVGGLAYVGLVALAMGASFPLSDFGVVFRTKIKGVVIGWISQFGAMPLMAYGLSKAFDLDPFVAIGVILVGAAPGGSTSNLFTYLVGGNVALSVVMSFLSTVCEFFMLPIMWVIYIRNFTDQTLEVPYMELIQAGLTILIPLVIGALIRVLNHSVCRVKCGCSAKMGRCICCCHPYAVEWTQNPPSGGLTRAYIIKNKVGRPIGPANEFEMSKIGNGTEKELPIATVTPYNEDKQRFKLDVPKGARAGDAVAFLIPERGEGRVYMPKGVRYGEQFAVVVEPMDVPDNCFCFVAKWVEKVGAYAGVIVLIITIILGLNREKTLFANAADYWKEWFIAFIFQPLGCGVGYLLGFIMWLLERYILCCRCKCGDNEQRLDCKDLRAISIETGVQSLALMLALATLKFDGCEEEEVIRFILMASLVYGIHSIWYVIALCYCAKACDEKCANMQGLPGGDKGKSPVH